MDPFEMTFAEQLAVAYQKTFLSQNMEWFKPSVLLTMFAFGIAAVFYFEYVIEPNYIKKYRATHQDEMPSVQEITWFRAGALGVLLLVISLAMLVSNWP